MIDGQFTPAAEEEQFPAITLEEICDIIEQNIGESEPNNDKD